MPSERHPVPDVAAVRDSAIKRKGTSPRTQLERARRALRDGDWAKVRKLASQLIDSAADTEDQAIVGSARVLLGQAAEAVNDAELAEEHLRLAITTLSEVRSLVWQHADHVADLGIALASTGSPDAEEALRRAVELGEGTVQVRRLLAWTLIDAGQREEARGLLADVIRRVPDDWRALRSMASLTDEPGFAAELLLSAGDAASQAGRLQEAKDAYWASDDLAPTAAAKHGIADTASRLTVYQEAAQVTERILADEPDDYQARLLHTEALLGLGDVAAAAVGARTLIAVNPRDPLPHAHLGMALRALDENAEAVAELREAHRLMPDNAPLRWQLSWTLAQNGDTDGAGRLLDEGIEADPGNVNLLLARAQLASTPDNLAAVEAAVSAVAEENPWEVPWVWLARARAGMGDLTGALAAADRGVRTEPANYQALELHGDLLVQMGRLDEGIDALSRSMTRMPLLETANSLGFALLNRGTEDDLARAEELARAMIKSVPHSVSGVELLGNVFLTTGREGELLTLSDEAAERLHTDPILGWLRARALNSLDQTAEALEVAQGVMAELDQVPALHTFIGQLHNQLSFAPDQDHEQHVVAAMAALTRAIELDDADIEATELLGQLYAGRQELDAAERLLSRARELEAGEDPTLLADLGRIWYLQGKSEEALRAVEEAYEQAPGYVNALITKGEALSALGRHDESAEAFRLALEQLPDDPYVLSALGESYRMLQLFDAAERCLTAALEQSPDDSFALASRGAVRHARGDSAGAMADLTLALRNTPTYIFALSNHLSVLMDNGQVSDALPLWEAAVEQDQENIELRTMYADTLRLAGKNQEAQPIVEHSLRDEPENVLALRVYGSILLALNRVDEGAAQFERALSVDPKSTDAAMDFADAQLRQGKPLASLDTLRTAITWQANTPAALLAKESWLLSGLAAWPEAEAAGRAALAAGPRDLEAHMALSWALRHSGVNEEALVVCRAAAELAPQDKWARRELGNALWEAGLREQAITAFEWISALAETASGNDDWHSLGWVLLCLGRYDRAATCFTRALATTEEPTTVLFDLGLNSIADGHPAEGLETYTEALAIVDRDTRNTATPERGLSHRGPIAVAVHDLRIAQATGRIEKSEEIGELVKRLTDCLLALKLPW